ncbi:MAG: lipid-A-disaccharide synthase [Nitrospirae bacterium]|nr:lipid-A-disaccharide synthase [Nitrospirota bacterium]
MPLTGGAAPNVFLSACEASADLHGAHLMRAIAQERPAARFAGIGGERMGAAGQEQLFHARDLSVMGLTEVLGRLGAVRRAFAAARRAFAEGGVDVAVLIDAPDFNLRLAAHARRAGIPVVYFIGPKFWAWRKGRLRTIAARVDHMMTILPFEKPLYDAAGVPATYVGNPLVDEMAEVAAAAPTPGGWRPSDLGLDDARPLVALLPGSRPGEIAAILPGLLDAAGRVAERVPDAQFALPVAPSLDGAAIRARVAACGVPVTCLDGRAVELLCAARVAAMASGTVTLQAALAGTPGVIVYRVSPLTWAVGRRLVTLSHVGLVNLVAGEGVVPELLQDAFTPEAVAEQLVALLADGGARDRQCKGLARVRGLMGGAGAPRRAARVVLDHVRGAA